ncbi:MAG: regulatory protein RecX [Selenomonadaceae bacterium]|nr:regulatory protein RecX [Selenomonadaceae bacterium]
MTAVDIIARRETSEANLIDKLKRKAFDERDITGAVAKLKEMNYLNDKAAARRQFEFLYNESKSSVREIVLKLMRRGFTREDINAAIPDAKDRDTREIAAALKSLRLKYKKTAEPIKMKAYLYRHGFSMDVCSSAVEEFLSED